MIMYCIITPARVARCIYTIYEHTGNGLAANVEPNSSCRVQRRSLFVFYIVPVRSCYKLVVSHVRPFREPHSKRSKPALFNGHNDET